MSNENEMTDPEVYMRPDWDEGGRVHNWRHYISAEVQEAWSTFAPEQRAMLYRQADSQAECEDWD